MNASKNIREHINAHAELELLIKAAGTDAGPRVLDIAAKRARFISGYDDLNDGQYAMINEIYLAVIRNPAAEEGTISEIKKWVIQDRHENYWYMKRLLGGEPGQELWMTGSRILDDIEKRPETLKNAKKMLRD